MLVLHMLCYVFALPPPPLLLLLLLLLLCAAFSCSRCGQCLLGRN
jgi:hypothetical protein